MNASIGDRAYFQGFSVIVEDTDDSGPYPVILVRYATTNRTERIAADALDRTGHVYHVDYDDI